MGLSYCMIPGGTGLRPGSEGGPIPDDGTGGQTISSILLDSSRSSSATGPTLPPPQQQQHQPQQRSSSFDEAAAVSTLLNLSTSSRPSAGESGSAIPTSPVSSNASGAVSGSESGHLAAAAAASVLFGCHPQHQQQLPMVQSPSPVCSLLPAFTTNGAAAAGGGGGGGKDTVVLLIWKTE